MTVYGNFQLVRVSFHPRFTRFVPYKMCNYCAKQYPSEAFPYLGNAVRVLRVLLRMSGYVRVCCDIIASSDNVR